MLTLAQISNLPSRELIKQVTSFGTPTYVYDQRTINSRLEQLALAFMDPDVNNLFIFYALKANSNQVLVNTILEGITETKAKGVGIGLDVVSPGEMAMANRFGDIGTIATFNNPSLADLEFVDESRELIRTKSLINIDSLSMLDKFGEKHPDHEIFVRLNPNIGAGHHSHCITAGVNGRFGIPLNQIPEIKRIAENRRLKIIGVHQHIGSGIRDHLVLLQAADVILEAAKEFPDLKAVDFGGGFGVPYHPDELPLNLDLLGEGIKQRFRSFGRKYRSSIDMGMAIEPGRFLVAESGCLLVTVTCIKEGVDGRVFVGTDSGFNQLVRPTMYGSYHHIINLSNPDAEPKEVWVVGNVCENGDRFTPEPRMIANPKEGDILAILCAGAYGFSMSSNYNARPQPAEVMIVDDNDIRLIRRRQDPEWLALRVAGAMLDSHT